MMAWLLPTPALAAWLVACLRPWAGTPPDPEGWVKGR